MNIDSPEIRFAIQSVRQASMTVKHVQSTLVSPALTKNDRSPVTVADFTSQAIVGYMLAQTFPGEYLVAEEDSAALSQPDSTQTLQLVTGYVKELFPHAGADNVCAWIDYGRADSGQRFWTLDPIDGTKGFLRGEQYAVALALVVEGQVEIGVLGCPNLRDASLPDPDGRGSLIVAVRGQGSWSMPLNTEQSIKEQMFTRLTVSELRRPVQARILRSVESGHTNLDQIDQFAQQLGIKAPAISMDSQVKYAVLAAGKGELYLRLLSPDKPNYREKIWDQAAGSLIIEEAGGQVTDLYGQPLDFTTGRSLSNNRGVLASNRQLHPAALAALAQIGA
jgi:3'(2'), 5'-bisphosphate nucleotidase